MRGISFTAFVRTVERRRWRFLPAAAAAVLAVAVGPGAAFANVPLTRLSIDTFTNSSSQHHTEVEPDTFVRGSTIVSAFQVGRIFGGGASDIGWATSTNEGSSWANGFLPGLTLNVGGTFQAASDPAVAFDAKHNVWLISSLGVNGPGGNNAVFVSRSTNSGLTWSGPVTVTTGSLDKDWIVCDNTPTSPFFGNCYLQYDIPSLGDAMRLRMSNNGGLSWGPSSGPSDGATGLGGQPVVRPNGTVIVPFTTGSQIRSFRSINGGQSWRATVLVANVTAHTTAGGIRVDANAPSAEIDAAGTVDVAWSDCRFRPGCPSNDILISQSTSETTWGAPFRVPIDPTTSTLDHFIPGLGVDASTSGTGAHLGLTYYFYPNANCSSTTCQLDAGFISSTNGGSSWSAPIQLAGPMNLSWLPNTSQGRMFGDYISTSVRPGGVALPIIPVANQPSGGLFDLAMYAPKPGLQITGGLQTAGRGLPAAVPGGATVPSRTTARTAN